MQQVQDFNSFKADKGKFYKDLRSSNVRERILRMESVLKLSALANMNKSDVVKALVHRARNLFEKN